MSKELSKDFLHELFKISLKKTQVLLLSRDYLKYHYLPGEEYKLIWESILAYYEINKACISIGILSQKFNDHERVQIVLAKIKTAQLISQDDAIEQLKEFIRRNIFIDAYDQIGDLYQKGSREEAIELLKSAHQELESFSIRKSVGYTEVFKTLTTRLLERKDQVAESKDAKDQRKLPTGIIPFDSQIGGGVDRGDIFCAVAGSGIGKSKLLKFIGISLSRRGFKVLHIQLEGSESEALDAYDAGITGITVNNIENGVFSQKDLDTIESGSKYIQESGGELFVKSYSQFNSATMLEIRDLIAEIGDVDALILDYIELAEPGNGKRYKTDNEGERARRTAISNEFKNIAVEFDIGGFTATQSTTIDDKERNDPDFVMTRYHLSEFKGLVKPFSYLVTLNQTDDEYENGIIRIYGDKTRKYKLRRRVMPVYTMFNHERFYDHKKTIEAFGYD